MVSMLRTIAGAKLPIFFEIHRFILYSTIKLTQSHDS